MTKRLSRLLRRRSSERAPFETSSEVLDHYVAALPSAQNAIDCIPGWIGAMPPRTGLKAGKSALFADSRIAWLLRANFKVRGKSVLELGPLEGFHTFMIHRAGAASIDAIEANVLAFMRCLITKEVLGIHRAHFYLGDFSKWLEATERHYDLIVASGVLYHSPDPVRLLELIGEKSDAFYLWTHYFDETAMPSDDLRRSPFSEAVDTRAAHGLSMRLHERSYFKAWQDPSFCGGLQDRHFWMERADILALIERLGFTTVAVAHEQPDHVNGPCFSVFAARDVTQEPAEAGPATSAVSPVTATISTNPAATVAPSSTDGSRHGDPGTADTAENCLDNRTPDPRDPTGVSRPDPKP